MHSQKLSHWHHTLPGCLASTTQRHCPDFLCLTVRAHGSPVTLSHLANLPLRSSASWPCCRPSRALWPRTVTPWDGCWPVAASVQPAPATAGAAAAAAVAAAPQCFSKHTMSHARPTWRHTTRHTHQTSRRAAPPHAPSTARALRLARAASSCVQRKAAYLSSPGLF